MQTSLLSYSLNYLSRIVTAFCMNKIIHKVSNLYGMCVCFSVFLLHSTTVYAIERVSCGIEYVCVVKQ